MKKPEPYIDERGERYLNLRQAAEIVCGFSERTLRAWAKDGRTSFHFPLQVIHIPVLKHRLKPKDEAPTINPLAQRTVILERDVRDLKEIVESAGRTEPGPWSPYELVTLEARSNAVVRRRKQQSNNHEERPLA